MEAFLLSVISGVSAAVSYATIVWIFTGCKNLKLKQAITSSIEGISYSVGTDGVGMILHNKTHVPVNIRSVEMILSATKRHRELKEGERSGRYRLNYNGPSEFGSKRGTEDQGDSRNFIELPAYTSGRWIVPFHAFTNGPLLKQSDFDGCEIKLEYLTLYKSPKVILVKFDGKGHSSGVINAMEKRRQDIVTNGIQSFLPSRK